MTRLVRPKIKPLRLYSLGGLTSVLSKFEYNTPNLAMLDKGGPTLQKLDGDVSKLHNG